MACPVCASDTPQAGCPACGLKQPTLFNVPAPKPPSATKLVNAILRDRERIAGIEMKQGRIAALKALDRPVIVALVACSKQKRQVPLPAKDLYVGEVFRLTMQLAAKCADEIYILSAKHGLVPLDEQVHPYDRVMKDLPKRDRTRWGEGVIASLKRRLPDLRLQLVGLAGKEYLAPLTTPLCSTTWTMERPLVGKGIGQQKAWLKSEYDRLCRQPMSVHPPMRAGHG